MKNWKIWIPIIVAILIAILGWFVFDKPSYEQTIKNSPGNTIIQNTAGDVVVGDRVEGDKIVNLGKVERKLNSEQINILKKLITEDRGRVGFVSKIFNSESKNFAASISSVFSEAGWEVVSPINQTLLDDFDGDATLFASISLHTRANLVCEALNRANIVCGPQKIRDGAISGNFLPDIVYIVIDSQ